MSAASMTGFGRGTANDRDFAVSVEISAVNRKQFDCTIVMPDEIAVLESNVATQVRQAITRGRIRVAVSLSSANARPSLVINKPQVAAELAALRDLAKDLGLKGEFGAETLLRLPDALRFGTNKPEMQRVLPILTKATEKAIDALKAMRRREGKILAKDLVRRLRELKSIHLRLTKRAERAPKLCRDKLLARLEKLAGDVEIPPETLAREAVIFADRMDVSEELTRIASHLAQAHEILKSDEPAGRPLDFLCQELLREINTVASKSGDVEIARATISFKSLLETVREQAQNFE